MSAALRDNDGYPTEEALERIRTWPATDLRGMMAFVRELWAYPEYWHESERDGKTVIAMSTAGRSGNESLIEAMQENRIFWLICWQSHRRGGHYEFHCDA